MKKVFFILSSLFLLPLCLKAQTDRKIKSYDVKFKIKNAGFWVNGSLKGLHADIRFAPDALDKSSVETSVDVNTIDTGNKKRDNHLRAEDYFDVEKYPQITMKSVSFTASKDKKDAYIGRFDVTIRGITKRVSIPFTFTESGDKATFNGSFKINRLDFKVGSSSWILSNNVVVNILVNAEK